MERPSGGDMTSAFASALDSATSTPAPEASPASTPAPETPEAAPVEGETTAAAIAQPAAETTETAPASTEEPAKGEPPQWRWQDILETQRTKAAAEAEARVKQEYDTRIAEYENERRGYDVLTAALHGDPEALAKVAQVDPGLAARLRGPVQTPSAPEPEPQPDAAIQLADGSTVPVYTPEGMKKREAWLQQQLTATLAKEFAPLKTAAERLAEAQRMTEQQEATRHWAAAVLAPVQRLPYFEEFRPAILKAIQAVPETHSGPLDEVVYATYQQLLTAKVEASTTSAESKALASLQQRAVAGTSHPSASTTTTPGKFRPSVEGFTEALTHFSETGTR